YLVVAAGLAARAEPDLERAARASGAGAGATLRTVTLPLALPAIAAAAVLVFVLTLGTFAIPQVLGAPAGFDTITTTIYGDLSLGGDPASFLEAVTLALLLVLATAVCVAPADAFAGSRLRTTRPADTQGARAVPGPRAVRRGQSLVLASVTRAVGVPPTPRNWSTDHFRQVLTPRTFEALSRSMGLALAAATL